MSPLTIIKDTTRSIYNNASELVQQFQNSKSPNQVDSYIRTIKGSSKLAKARHQSVGIAFPRAVHCYYITLTDFSIIIGTEQTVTYLWICALPIVLFPGVSKLAVNNCVS